MKVASDATSATFQRSEQCGFGHLEVDVSSLMSPSTRCSSLVLGVAPALGLVTITTINFFSSILYSVNGCSSANIFPVNQSRVIGNREDRVSDVCAYVPLHPQNSRSNL